MRFQPLRIVGVSFEIGAVGHAFPEQHMHDRAGQRAIGAGLQHQAHIGLLHRRVLVDIDDDDPGATLLPRLDGVGHDIDLRDHGIGAPDHHAVGLRHLARIGTAQGARSHHPAGPGQIGADRAEEAGVFFRMAQPVDAVALHQPHRAGIEIRPDGLGAVFFFGRDEFLGDDVECRFPAGFFPDAVALGAGANKRLQQSVRMMDTIGIARDLGADHTSRIGVGLGAMDAADAVAIEQLDLERAGRRAIMRTGGVADAELGVLVHGVKLTVYDGDV
ncbi:hypothetical protein X733_05615 [Mesorhizobium sp. L2C067A000]|nr:hypothetical protein X733_05615 [Mesorhizobium sp. L2C067A000]